MTLPLLDGVKLDGFPVEQLYPGWSPSSRDVVADDFSVVVFKEDATGKQACWWLEGDDYRASHVLTLDEAVRKRLLVAMDRVFWPVATGVLGAPLPPQASPSCETWPEIAVNELSGSWIGGFAPHTLLLPSGHADSGEALSCPNGRQIAENRLTALLAAQRGQGPLIVSSPFTALPLLAQITFQVQSLSVSRFQDADTVFYLIWNEAFPALRPSFYYPDAPMLISDDPAAAMIPGLILGWYARHPEHVSLIRDARPFRAEDFGVGQASGFRSTPPEETPPPSPPEEAPSYTLSQPPAPTSHLPASGQRLKSRIKSLFSRR